ncbi:MAG: hypothetical protein ACK4PR_04455 [Gammaproteobacteria bacterium]
MQTIFSDIKIFIQNGGDIAQLDEILDKSYEQTEFGYDFNCEFKILGTINKTYTLTDCERLFLETCIKAQYFDGFNFNPDNQLVTFAPLSPEITAQLNSYKKECTLGIDNQSPKFKTLSSTITANPVFFKISTTQAISFDNQRSSHSTIQHDNKNEANFTH